MKIPDCIQHTQCILDSVNSNYSVYSLIIEIKLANLSARSSVMLGLKMSTVPSHIIGKNYCKHKLNCKPRFNLTTIHNITTVRYITTIQCSPYQKLLTLIVLSTTYCSGVTEIDGHWSVLVPAALIHLVLLAESWHSLILEHLFSTTHQPHRGLPLPRQLVQSGGDAQSAIGNDITYIEVVKYNPTLRYQPNTY